MSESEVVNKQQVTAQSLLTSSQVAGLLQMNRASVNKWVRDGRLSAYKTPGGHHRIRVSDLVTFLAEHQLPIPPSLQPMMRQLVLVVDDDTDQLVAFKRALTRYQKRIRVEIADNGIDALVMIGALKPDVVILDIFMPGIDGIEVCKRLRKMSHTQELRVIVVSGKLTPDVEQAAIDAGASVCFQKPVSAQRLAEEIGVSGAALALQH